LHLCDVTDLRVIHSFELVKDIHLVAEDFSVENGCLTPTLKLKRAHCAKMFAEPIRAMYAYHASTHPATHGVSHPSHIASKL
jgi:long-subunit acyl-CoA synthetase (AMP-forming)